MCFEISASGVKDSLWLAPMAGTTDLAYRKLCKKYGCDISVTEMVSAKALHFGDKKSDQLMTTTNEGGIIGLQIFGSDPQIMAAITKSALNQLPFAFIDINMGCPAPKIVKNGEGSALMRDVELAQRIVSAVQNASDKPITVKIRKGWDDNQINAVAFGKAMAAAGASLITIHGRTREQMYSGQADWQIIGDLVAAVNIPVIGNGDITSPQDATAMQHKTGCAGVMIGRGAQGKPWLFKQIKDYQKIGHYSDEPSPEQRIAIIERHIDYMRHIKPEHIIVLEMRKHIAWYLKGLVGSAPLRAKINRAKSIFEILSLLKSAYSNKSD